MDPQDRDEVMGDRESLLEDEVVRLRYENARLREQLRMRSAADGEPVRRDIDPYAGLDPAEYARQAEEARAKGYAGFVPRVPTGDTVEVEVAHAVARVGDHVFIPGIGEGVIVPLPAEGEGGWVAVAEPTR